MKPTLSSLVTNVTRLLFAIALLTSIAVAQTDVEIEVVGPWSYVQDPNDSSRVILVAPNAYHEMAVFKGEDAFNTGGATAQVVGIMHTLDFPLVTCRHPSSNPPLYGINGVTSQGIQNAITSNSSYVLSLPKPCSYKSRLLSRFTYNSAHSVGVHDPESKFTSWMTLHYKVLPTTTAVLDQNYPITFGSNNGTSAKAISIVLHIPNNIGSNTNCDSHSRHAFYLTETLWGVPHVYRVFPGLTDDMVSSNTQGSYDYTCEQIKDPLPDMTPDSKLPKASSPAKNLKTKNNVHIFTPGRADCHAPQVNVNGIVH